MTLLKLFLLISIFPVRTADAALFRYCNRLRQEVEGEFNFLFSIACMQIKLDITRAAGTSFWKLSAISFSSSSLFLMVIDIIIFRGLSDDLNKSNDEENIQMNNVFFRGIDTLYHFRYCLVS